jgi:hypothetical protein
MFAEGKHSLRERSGVVATSRRMFKTLVSWLYLAPLSTRDPVWHFCTLSFIFNICALTYFFRSNQYHWSAFLQSFVHVFLRHGLSLVDILTIKDVTHFWSDQKNHSAPSVCKNELSIPNIVCVIWRQQPSRIWHDVFLYIYFYETTWRYSSKDCHLHIRLRKDPKSHLY